MPNYNFEALNDKDFENLVRDLLQKELNLTLESFKKGRDKGIDLRYCCDLGKESNIIIQAKHWINSNFNQLKNYLLNEELKKVKDLKPTRYIIATTIGLTPNNKDIIKKIFDPYIINLSDIYGKDDLENLLGKFPEIEKLHFKLWLSSTNILQEIVNNAIKGRSEFLSEKISKYISLFVPNRRFEEAAKILEKEKFLMITGEPGIGKSLMAKFLVTNYLAEGFELIYIDEKIREAEEVIIPDKKQIFYFDDFLGSNYLEIIQSKNSDSALLNFIERVQSSFNKRIILTCRTTILNQAKQDFEKYKNSKFSNSNFEIFQNDYDKFDKAKILYNHISFLNLSLKYKDKIIEDKNYYKIINHSSFNPRIIEFITDPINVQNIDPANYLEFIMDKLDNPELIWETSYSKQIDDYCRFLLTSIFSLGDMGNEDIVQEVYLARLDYEIKNNGFSMISNPFFSKVKELIGGFLKREIRYNDIASYSFFNPSIIDFLINYINNYSIEKWRIIESSIYLEQFEKRFQINQSGFIKFSRDEIKRLFELLKKRQDSLKVLNNRNKYLNLIYYYFNNFPIDIVKEESIKLFKQIDFEDISWYDSFYTYVQVLTKSAEIPVLRVIIIKKWDYIISKLFEYASDKYDYESIYDLFHTFQVNYNEFTNNKEHSYIQSYIDSYWVNEIEELINNNPDLDNIYELYKMEDKISSFYEDAIDFNKKMNVLESPSFRDFENFDCEEKVNENIGKVQEEEDDYYNRMKDYPTEGRKELKEEKVQESNKIEEKRFEEHLSVDNLIDNLFS